MDGFEDRRDREATSYLLLRLARGPVRVVDVGAFLTLLEVAALEELDAGVPFLEALRRAGRRAIMEAS